ncbi:MAG: YcaQ family DNA glycosylase [Clostridia bacterium]|nr:YcaQ family DNA glycosylase [Clostridia bacterium]
MKITKAQARKFLIDYHYLNNDFKLKGKEGILEYIDKVGCIQFDPLDQVGYNSHLVLQSRIANYHPVQLNELLYIDRILIDFWDKNMSIYRTCDLPFFKRYQRDKVSGEVAEKIIEKITEKGQVCSSDFEKKEKIDWWWGPTSVIRYTLENMYHSLELIISDKKGSKKYYDLAANHIDEALLLKPEPFTANQEFFNWMVKRRIRSIGLLWNKASDAYLGIRHMKSKDRNNAFAALLEKNDISMVTVEGVDEPLYIASEYMEFFNKSISQPYKGSCVRFLAPLDNMLWDRKLIKQLFEFEYKWEVYTPEKERKYGYYVLPVLYKDKFIARVEMKYIKKSRTLEINSWWWEEKEIRTKDFQQKLFICINEFMHYLGAERVEYKTEIV